MRDVVIARRESGRELRLGPSRGSQLMGIVNVTPDSFFDGGRFDRVDAAVAQAERLVEEGAAILDLGAESTRPGHETVPDDEQIGRLLPVLDALRPRLDTIPISIDTTRAAVARATLDAGADWINDTLALSGDPDLAAVVAEAGAPIVLMHRFSPPRVATTDTPCPPNELVTRIAGGLSEAVSSCLEAGISPDRILLDPGIGFGTLLEDNLAIHATVEPLRELGLPLLFGPSRKSFLGHLTGRDADDRLCATAASIATLTLDGVEVLRVHDVAAMRDVVRVTDAIRRAKAQAKGSPG